MTSRVSRLSDLGVCDQFCLHFQKNGLMQILSALGDCSEKPLAPYQSGQMDSNHWIAFRMIQPFIMVYPGKSSHWRSSVKMPVTAKEDDAFRPQSASKSPAFKPLFQAIQSACRAHQSLKKRVTHQEICLLTAPIPANDSELAFEKQKTSDVIRSGFTGSCDHRTAILRQDSWRTMLPAIRIIWRISYALSSLYGAHLKRLDTFFPKGTLA